MIAIFWLGHSFTGIFADAYTITSSGEHLQLIELSGAPSPSPFWAVRFDGRDVETGSCRQHCEDRASAIACTSKGTNSFVPNFPSWLSLSLTRSKKRPFVHFAALGWKTEARRRATIRSTTLTATPRLAIRIAHRASAALSRWYRVS